MDAPDDLFGPPDVPMHGTPDVVEEVGDPVVVGCRQFIRRWVFFAHHRATALAELQDLIAKAKAAK